jgi:DNA-binding transcriptional LysR family regulator
MTTSEVLEAIDMGQADFGITYFGAHTPQHEVVRLADDEVVLAIRSDHPFAKKTKVRWSELGKQKLISTWKGAGVRMLIDFELAKTLTRLPWFYEVQQISTALSFVEAGLGVAAVPKAFVPRAAAPQIQTVRLVDPVVTGGLNLVRPQGRRLRPLVEELWTILQQQVRTRFSARG